MSSVAIIGDIAILQEYEGKGNKNGTFSGVMTFCYKAGQGIVTAISTALLTTVGFVSGAATQTEKASEGIGWILMIGIVFFMGVGLIVLSRLRLDKNKINTVLALEKEKQENALHYTGIETIVESEDIEPKETPIEGDSIEEPEETVDVKTEE